MPSSSRSAVYLLGEGGLHIPRFTVAGFDIPPERFVPGLYYVIAGAFLGSTLILWRISRSPFGTALRAIRDNDSHARSASASRSRPTGGPLSSQGSSRG